MRSVGFIGRIAFLLFLFTSSIVQAESCGFAQTIYGPFQFRQVELVSRVHSVGLWRGGDVVLNPWIEISENAYLGVDKYGQVLNVLRLKDRTVAFLLSGERKIKDIFFYAPGALLAVDVDGDLLSYEQSIWQRSTLKSILTQGLVNYGTTVCAAGLGLFALSWLSDTPYLAPEIVASLGLSSAAALMIEAFRAAVKFEKQNESTDGFRSLNVRFPELRRTEFQRDGRGLIADYLLSGGGKQKSLLQLVGHVLLQQGKASFDVTCEHELLPRGIPPENYEPKF